MTCLVSVLELHDPPRCCNGAWLVDMLGDGNVLVLERRVYPIRRHICPEVVDDLIELRGRGDLCLACRLRVTDALSYVKEMHGSVYGEWRDLYYRWLNARPTQ